MPVKISALLILLCSVIIYPQEVKKDSIPQKYSYSTVEEFWKQMDDIFNDPNFNNANWGVLIQSLTTGEYLYKRNEDKLFIPASDLKLFTTAGALSLLGSDYRYKTNIYAHGKMDGSILRGDLIVEGRGDPTISGRFYNNDMLKVFNFWADSLLEYGIDEIDGNLIGDDNEFDDIGLGEGWEWNNESYWYSAPTGAISFNDNCIDIYVSVNREKNSAVIRIDPDTKYAVIINNVRVVPKDSATSIDVVRERGTNVITVFGTIRERDSAKTYVTVNNPTQYAMVVFRDVLEKKGITVKGFPLDIDDIPASYSYSRNDLILSFDSPPLKEIIKVVNKNSMNLFAEQLLKTIGMEKEHFGSAATGIDALGDFFREVGLNPGSMVMVDGSGLSRLDLVSPRHFVTLLNYIYKSKFFIPFYNSLPIAGIDGTLGTRMKNTLAENRVRAKTGYLENVRSLSGYALTGDDEPVAFSIIVNNFSVPVKLAENTQDLVCLRLANFRRKKE